MSKKIKNKKSIFFVLAVILFCFFAYQHWGNADSSNSQLISTKDISNVGDETLKLLSELRTLTLDEDIFLDKVFQNLEDFRMDLQTQPIGRNNPFAVVGTDGDYINVNVNSSQSSECEGDNCLIESSEGFEETEE